MRSKNAPHRCYRALLHLYPKEYRREYAGQMLQTLQDMLDDNNNTLDRTMIWLRVAVETPLSIIKENGNNIGEKSMSKLATISNKRLLIGGVSIAVIVLAVAVGIWRNSIVSGVATLAYASSVRSTATDQRSKLADPFVKLAGADPKVTTSCSTWRSGALDMQMLGNCAASMQAYTKLGQSAEDKTKVLQSVDAVTDALKRQGYQAGSNGMTLASLVAGTYEGKDYSPDAAYQRTIGKDVCVFDVTVAYSNPATPAINMTLNCGRTMYPFGKPSSAQFDVRG